MATTSVVTIDKLDCAEANKVREAEDAFASTRDACAPQNYVALALSRDATSFSAPPTTINSCAAGLSGGNGNDFPSTVRMDLA